MESTRGLSRLCAELGVECAEPGSIYFVRDDERVDDLRAEFAARREAGLEVEWADRARLESEWGVRAAGGIVSASAAEADPFHLCHALLRRAIGAGAAVHDRTTVTEIEVLDGGVALHTDRGPRVRARWVAHATGFEAAASLPRGVVDLVSTYALATEPTAPAPGRWADRRMLWEMADPYLYLRWRGDRLIAGGADVPFRNERLRDRLIGAKAASILKDLGALLPGVALETAFAWTGTFGATRDGLGYIGAPEGRERELFALGFGGNGITFSHAASAMLTDHVLGRANADARLFRFGR